MEEDPMESTYRGLFRDVCPGVVLVEQVGRFDYFCVGSVLQSEDGDTFILTQSSILESHSPPQPAAVAVRFFDGHRQPAEVLAISDSPEDPICILRTDFHLKCKPVQLFGGKVDHTYAAAMAPATASSAYNIPGFIIQRSLAAGGDVPGTILPRWSDFFIFACRYGDCSPNGVSRLTSGPVFNMDSKALGFVFGDLHYIFWPGEEQGCIIDEEFYNEGGFDLKVCVTASRLEVLLGTMLGDTDWRKALKSFGSST